MNFHISTRIYFSSYFSTNSTPFLTFQSHGCPRPIVQGQSVLLSVEVLSKDTPSLICYERLPCNLTQYLQRSLQDTNPNNAQMLGENHQTYYRFCTVFSSPKTGMLMIPGLASLSQRLFFFKLGFLIMCHHTASFSQGFSLNRCCHIIIYFLL